MTDKQIQKIIDDNGGGFAPEEFLEGRENLKKEILVQSVLFRNWHGYSTQITSAYRTTGSHKLALSIDVLLWQQWQEKQPKAMELWRLVTTWPWMGVGIYFDWNDGIGLHYDLAPTHLRTRPLRWLRVDGTYFYQSTSNGWFYTKAGDRSTSLEKEVLKVNGNKV